MLNRLIKWAKEFHFHKWEYDYPYQSTFLRWNKNVTAYRNCQKCPVVKKEDIHCLGLLPPKFIIRWYNVD